MIVVSDTSPLNYLVLIGHIGILPRLFGRVTTTPAVMRELEHERTPLIVRTWVRAPPQWLEIGTPHSIIVHPGLDRGELEAISLARELRATALLIDERRGRRAAERLGIYSTGTLGVLQRAANAGLLDFEASIQALRGTTFRLPREYL